MEETKKIFQDVDRNATQEIDKYISQNKDKYFEFIDKIVLKSVAALGKSGIIQANKETAKHVQSKLNEYKKQASVDLQVSQEYLDDTEYGVKLYNDTKQICVDSTIRQRIKQALHDEAPRINAIVLPDVPLIE